MSAITKKRRADRLHDALLWDFALEQQAAQLAFVVAHREHGALSDEAREAARIWRKVTARLKRAMR